MFSNKISMGAMVSDHINPCMYNTQHQSHAIFSYHFSLVGGTKANLFYPIVIIRWYTKFSAVIKNGPYENWTHLFSCVQNRWPPLAVPRPKWKLREPGFEPAYDIVYETTELPILYPAIITSFILTGLVCLQSHNRVFLSRVSFPSQCIYIPS